MTINGDNPFITDELTESTVQSITVAGSPGVFYDSPYYSGDFKILKVGKFQPFPLKLEAIKSVRMIKGATHSSKVTLYAYPFFSGKEESIRSQTPQLQGTYFSLKVTEGAVVFFDHENYTGGKRILLNGDEVQNFTAVKLTSIGKSVKTAGDMELQ